MTGINRWLLALVFVAPTAAGAQRVVVRDAGTGRGGAIVDSVLAGPHVIKSGTGPLVLPRDSTVTTSLLVLGQPTYVSSRVQGDVVVVGADLFLRPGVEIGGRAIAIGGTVSETTLGSVAGRVESLRDETLDVSSENGAVSLTSRQLSVASGDSSRLFRLAGIKGIKLPRYDRVNGLSLPVGVQLVPRTQVVIEPTATYRSRLGVVDPELRFLVGAETGTRLNARVARDTRTNDGWATPDLLNSLTSFGFGVDLRNYFRSDVAEARFFAPFGGRLSALQPFVGGRYERVWPITAAGNVYSVFARGDSDRIRRPNPLVERGHVASALAGVTYLAPEDAPIKATAALEAEQSIETPAGTSDFTQVTLDGMVDFPTVLNHRLAMRAHAVASLGDSVTRARYAYLGDGRTLSLLEPLEFGGDQLVFLDSRYLIPVERVMLPFVGPPSLTLIHRIGGAGVGSIGKLFQEVGLGVGLGPILLQYVTSAGDGRGGEFNVRVRLSGF